MTLQWYGQSFFRLETQGKVIAIDPFSRSSQMGILKVPRFKADVVLVSHNHADHNNAAAIESAAGGEPLVLREPGEYEIAGIFIEGIQSFHDNQGGKERGPNTIFVISSEKMRLCHMGDFGESKISAEALERINGADILLIPVGGKFTIGPAAAVNIISQIEPKVVVPMHYKVKGLKLPIESADQFWKEVGTEPEPEEKLTIKFRDLPQEGTKFVCLKPLAFS